MPMNGEIRSNTSRVERRHLTVLECDLVGSTALANKLDPEQLRDLVLAYQDCVLSLVKKNNGFFVQFAGDAIWVYFGYPYAHEDDACQAIRTGLEISKAVKSISIHNESLNVRVGIASGLCVVGNILHPTGTNDRNSQITALGRPPNLASRLQTLVAAGCVAVSDETRTLTGNVFEFEDLGFYDIKGFPNETKVWRVEKENTNQNRFSALRSSFQTPLVGRENELNYLAKLWTDVCLGKGRVLSLYGEPGIGKSRLITELAGNAIRVKSRRWWFQCGEYLQGSAFAPLIAQFQTLAEIINEDDALTRFDKLSDNFPMLSMHELYLLADFLSISDDFKSKISKSKRREKLYELLIKQIETDAKRDPILVVFEDIHWVDPSTLEFINYLALAIERLPIFLIITSRSTNFQEMVCIDLLYSHELRVKQLNHDDSFQLLKSLSEQIDLPSSLSQKIVQQTDGVPLFIEDLTISFLQTPNYSNYFSDNGKVTVPNKLSEHLMSRIDKLGESKKVAQIGSVVGKEFSLSMLHAVSDLAHTKIKTDIIKLIEFGIVIQSTKPGEPVYIFKHAMIRDAAYESLLITERIEFHARIGVWLEQEKLSQLHIQPETIAHHYEIAGSYDLAVNHWLEAGRQSISRSNYIESSTHMSNALQLLPKLIKSYERDYIELDILTTLALAYAGAEGIASQNTGRVYEKALLLCESLGYPEETFSVLSGLCSFYFLRSFFGKVQDNATLSIKLASNTRNSNGLVNGNRILGAVQFVTAHFDVSIKSLGSAINIYDENPAFHQRNTLAYALDHKTSALCYLSLANLSIGKLDSSLRNSNYSISHSKSVNLHSVNYALCYQASLFFLRSEPPITVARIAKKSLEIGLKEGYATWIGISRLLKGEAMIQMGNYEKGLQLINQGVSEHSNAMAQTFLPFAQSVKAKGHLITGDFDKSIAELTEAESLSLRTNQLWYLPEIQRLYAETLLELGETKSAHEYYNKALSTANNMDANFWKLKIAYSMATHQKYAIEYENTLLFLSETIDSIEEGFTSPFVIDAINLVKSNKRK